MHRSKTLLTPQGQSPMAQWKVTGKVGKIYDKLVKGFLFSMQGSMARITLPKDSRKGLALQHPFLILQFCVPLGKTLSIELVVTDGSRTRRYASNSCLTLHVD
jgi:hypothetical protein